MFFSLIHCALSIDAPNHPTLLGDALRTEIKIREIKWGNNRGEQFCVFTYSLGHRLKIVLYLAEIKLH
jgi:hypothetical protein